MKRLQIAIDLPLNDLGRPEKGCLDHVIGYVNAEVNAVLHHMELTGRNHLTERSARLGWVVDFNTGEA